VWTEAPLQRSRCYQDATAKRLYGSLLIMGTTAKHANHSLGVAPHYLQKTPAGHWGCLSASGEVMRPSKRLWPPEAGKRILAIAAYILAGGEVAHLESSRQHRMRALAS
jgi:hypothetical protein